MKVLILGGSRFIGKKLALRLLESGVDVITSSRRENLDFPADRQIVSERENLSGKLFNNQEFDFVIDFTCYNSDQLIGFSKVLMPSNYFLISTSWIGRKNYGAKSHLESKALLEGVLTPTESSYVNAKLESEVIARQVFRDGATIIRLPIVIGEGDHHHRLDFYAHRLEYINRPLLVNNGENQVHTVWVEDVVKLLGDVLDLQSEMRPKIISFVPPSSIFLKTLVTTLANSRGIEAHFTPIQSDIFEKCLPILAQVEPFWREAPCEQVATSIWDLLETEPTPWDDVFNEIQFNYSFSAQQIEGMLEEKNYLD